MYGCTWTLTSPHWQNHLNHIEITRSMSTPQGRAQQWPSCVFNWWRLRSNMSTWGQPGAYLYTDVDFDSDLWVCLDVDIITLAKSLESYWNHLFHEYTPRSRSAMIIMSIHLMTVTIQCGDVDAASSLFIHWCRLWLWCMGVPGRWHHHIGKVTWIILKPLVPWVYPKVELSNGHRDYSIDDGDDPMWRCGRSQ